MENLENGTTTDNIVTLTSPAMQGPVKPRGTLIKVMKGTRREQPSGYQLDYVAMWYRDEKHEKKCLFLDRPVVPYYVIKDKTSEEASKPPMFISLDKVERFECYSDLLSREICGQIPNGLAFYNKVSMGWGVRSAMMRDCQCHPWIYGSDMMIDDRMFAWFMDNFEPLTDYDLHTCYYDIEVDLAPNGLEPNRKGQIGYVGFPDEDTAPCPINLITLIDDRHDEIDIYTYIHKNPKNISIDEFMTDIKEKIKKIRDRIIEECERAGQHVVIKEFVQFFYDHEFDMIKGCIDKVHEIDPDIMSAWNSRFDFLTIQNRLIQLIQNQGNLKYGWTPEKAAKWILCDKKYMRQIGYTGEEIELEPVCTYRSDKKMNMSDRIDECIILDGINWFDQLLYYAAMRKQFGALDSYKLDDVALEELGIQKLKFPAPLTLKTAAWKNFELFFEYNVRDVVLLVLLGRKGEDYSLLQSLAEITQSCHAKVMRKTQSLKNYIAKFAASNGYVMNNNGNGRHDDGLLDIICGIDTRIQEEDPLYQVLLDRKEKFGAIVADMTLTENNGIEMFGKRSNRIYANCIDVDLRSLYPSIILALNLSRDTLEGKFYIENAELKDRLVTYFNVDPVTISSYALEAGDAWDLSNPLTDTLITQDWIRFGQEWLGLPSVEQAIADLRRGA